MFYADNKRTEVREIGLFETNDVDHVGFKDKVAMFIYFRDFDLSKIDPEQLQTHYKIVSKTRDFCGVRNVLMHGHSMFEVHTPLVDTKKTAALTLLSSKTVTKQLATYSQIMGSLAFFILKMQGTSFTESGKQAIVDDFLTTDFLNGQGGWEQ